MTERALQVTYRNGRAFAAYLALAHQTTEKSSTTIPSLDGLLVIDYAATDRPLGITFSRAWTTTTPAAARTRLGTDRGSFMS